MLLQSLFSIIAAAMIVSCSSTPPASSLTLEAARSEARRDIASGHMKIYFAGTYAAGPVGADAPGDWAFVSKLPQDHRLSKGCVDPDSQVHIAYARAYNREIIRYLRGHPNT
jgi:hypothetical protein